MESVGTPSRREPGPASLSLVTQVSGTDNTASLFGRVSRAAEQIVLPINDAALSKDAGRPSFFCVHSVSGVAGTDFLELARLMHPQVRFYGIQAPLGRMRDAEFGSSIDSLARFYSAAVMRHQPYGTVHVGGYCIGGVIALEVARLLKAAGREVGIVVSIDGAPENTGIVHSAWTFRHWLEVLGNVRGWLTHADLMRNMSLRSLRLSIASHVASIARGVLGLNRGQKLTGGYAIDSMMDLSIYPPDHRAFINRLFAALHDHVPTHYLGDVIVYEAKIAPLLYPSLVKRAWACVASNPQVIKILGTHIGMLRHPYVEALASDLTSRILARSGTQEPDGSLRAKT